MKSSGKKIKIGIFGGSFNPPHIGHLILAEKAFEQLNLDKLIFVPAYIPPHKINKQIAEPEHRLKMLELSIKSISGFIISSLEIDRKGTSFTYDTLLDLIKIYPEAKFYLLIGYDNLIDFHLWKNYTEILKLCSLAVFDRYINEEKHIKNSGNYIKSGSVSTGNSRKLSLSHIGVCKSKLIQSIPYSSHNTNSIPSDLPIITNSGGSIVFDLFDKNTLFRKKVLFLNTPRIDISSSEIRMRIRKKMKITFLVPENVEKYIIKNYLYK
jgi:nicotinate (nicotinamide) nucleotide adenylyltransferase